MFVKLASFAFKTSQLYRHTSMEFLSLFLFFTGQQKKKLLKNLKCNICNGHSIFGNLILQREIQNLTK